MGLLRCTKCKGTVEMVQICMNEKKLDIEIKCPRCGGERSFSIRFPSKRKITVVSVKEGQV